MQARLTVDRDIAEPFKRGVFSDPGRSYDAVIRFSSGRQLDDREPDAHGMAVKLLDVGGDRLAGEEWQTSQDFVLVDDELFFSGDLAEYEAVNRLVAQGTNSLLATLSLPRLAKLATALRLRGLGDGEVLDALRDFAGQTPATPLSTHYWSTTPYRLGESVVKYMAVSPRVRERRPDDVDENYLADTLVRDLAQGPAGFDLVAHVQGSEELQPIDDPTVSWSRNGASVVKLATIDIPKQVVDTASELAERIVFSPWNCLAAHEPCGKINLARRDVYAQLSLTRHDGQDAAEQRRRWSNGPVKHAQAAPSEG